MKTITKQELYNLGFEEDPLNCWHINKDEFKMFHEENGNFIQYKDTLNHDIGEPIIYVEELMERYKAYTGKELKYREADEPPTA